MATTIECFYGDDGSVVVNSTNVSMDDVGGSLRSLGGDLDSSTKKIVDALAPWVQATQGPRPRRLGGIWDRDRFVSPENTFQKVRVAREAKRLDDVIGTAADVTEALALSAMSIFTDDDDEQDAWNQWAGTVDLDSRLREIWHTLYTDSMVVVSTWWEQKQYTVRGRTRAGNRRRQVFDLTVPTGLSIIDSTKVAPVGTTMFQREGLAYIADADEAYAFDGIIAARDGLEPPAGRTRRDRYVSYTSNASSVVPSGLDALDPIVSRLVRRRYEPAPAERDALQREGVDTTNLFLLDSRFTFRHTLTKPTYQLFPDVRLERAFPILDLKAQLRQVDRAFLVGAASYIVLITQGSDTRPGQPEEINALRAGATSLGQIPLLVGDHRLNVQIITPKVDISLDAEKWDNLDRRLTALSYGTFAAVGNDSDDPLKTGRVIGRNLEGRRRMMRRSIEANVFDAIRVTNASLTGRAKLRFHPEQISLAFDVAWANTLLDLREANETSRETTLSQLGLDQADEAALRRREAEHYDDTFETFVPHGANPNQGQPGDDPGMSTRLAQRMGGRRRGGNRNGGGAAPGTGQGQESTDPRRSRTADYLAGLNDMDRDSLIAEAAEFDIPGRWQMRKADLRAAISAAADPGDEQ